LERIIDPIQEITNYLEIAIGNYIRINGSAPYGGNKNGISDQDGEFIPYKSLGVQKQAAYFQNKLIQYHFKVGFCNIPNKLQFDNPYWFLKDGEKIVNILEAYKIKLSKFNNFCVFLPDSENISEGGPYSYDQVFATLRSRNLQYNLWRFQVVSRLNFSCKKHFTDNEYVTKENPHTIFSNHNLSGLTKGHPIYVANEILGMETMLPY